MSLVFRTKPEQGSARRLATETLNALAQNVGHVYIVGNVLDDASYAEFVEHYATDDGTSIIRGSVPVSQFRQAVKALAASTGRKVTFFPEQAFIADAWTIVGYRAVEQTA